MKVRVTQPPAQQGQPVDPPKALSAGDQALVDYALKLGGFNDISEVLAAEGELGQLQTRFARGNYAAAIGQLENSTEPDQSAVVFDPSNEEHIKYAYASLAGNLLDLQWVLSDDQDPSVALKHLRDSVALINDPKAQSNAKILVTPSKSSSGDMLSIDVNYDIENEYRSGGRWSRIQGIASYGDGFIWNIGTNGRNYGITNPGNSMFAGSKRDGKKPTYWRDGYYDVYNQGLLDAQKNLKMLYASGSINDDGTLVAEFGRPLGIEDGQIVSPYQLHDMVVKKLAEGQLNRGQRVVAQPAGTLKNPFR